MRAALSALVATLAHPPVEASSLMDETRLFDGGLDLDSIAIMELVVALDERFGVRAVAEDVGPANFATFGRLCAFVAARAPAGGNVPAARPPG